MTSRKVFSVFMLVGIIFSQMAFQPSNATKCNWAQFVADITIPDGTYVTGGTMFVKTWRLKNIGTCTWKTNYKIVFSSGDQMGAMNSYDLPVEIPPGQLLDVTVRMLAPLQTGHYRGFWKLSSDAGALFGIGTAASNAIWADINVMENTAAIYDFVGNAPYAQWKSGAGTLPYPSSLGDGRGFAYRVENPLLENGAVDVNSALLTSPQNKYNGYIQAIYPDFYVQSGDHFQALVDCEYSAAGCNVTFRLDYMNSAGTIRTLWSWREYYNGQYKRADVDLSLLAGQNVKFILTLLAAGSATDDRALWVAPRIARFGGVFPSPLPPTLTPMPSFTPTVTPFVSPPAITPTNCDKASLVSDLSIPDGTTFSPNTPFIKTWRVKNAGSCGWTTAYSLVFYSGDLMSSPTLVNLPSYVAPGQYVDLSVNMVAPAKAGRYRGNWVLRNSSGGLFGAGITGNPIWVDINVAGGSSDVTGYDFVSNVCSAQWKVAIGVLPCPGYDGDSNGFVLSVDPPVLEDGTIGAPGLLLAPQYVYNGIIQGKYPAVVIQPGDRFRSSIGCQIGASCYATFRLDYVTSNGSTGTFWSMREKNDGRVQNVDVDLNTFAGRSVQFILTVYATGSAVGDRVIWDAPRIVHTDYKPAALTPTPTLTPTVTVTVPPTAITPTADWYTYINTQYQYQFMYPPQSVINSQDYNNMYLTLPIVPGTNLHEKYLEMRVVENVDTCYHPLAAMELTKETVVINGITYTKRTGMDAGMSKLYKWVEYSTVHNTTCVAMLFIMRSVDPGAYLPVIVPVYDEAAESAVFDTIMSTFKWLDTTVTRGPYAVINIPFNSTLSIYSAAGLSNPVIDSFAYNATDITRTGVAATVDGATWWEVWRPLGGNGWVNSYYLTEYVPSSTFCADARIIPMIDAIKQSANEANSGQFSTLISPAHGVNISLWRYAQPINFTTISAGDIYSSTASYTWGSGPSGILDIGSFKDVVQPKLVDTFGAPNRELYCDSLTKVFPLSEPWPYSNIHFYHVYKPGTTSQTFDFRTWLVGFEYINGQPYLFGMVHIIWEP
jgi:hypothetical protein